MDSNPFRSSSTGKVAGSALLGVCLLIGLSLFGASAASAAPLFGPATGFATGIAPRAVTTADFNGDGNVDLATANLTGMSISVLFGDGSGGFGARNDFPTGKVPVSITSADFDDDGKPDLAATNPEDFPGFSTVMVLINNGSGGFGSVASYDTYGSSYAVTSADYNDDGKRDLATADGSASAVSVLFGNGNGGFGAANTFDSGAAPYSITSVDFNGDGKKDLATANDNGSVSVLFNGIDGDDNGYFGSRADFPTGTPYSISVTSADFNGDSKADLATANLGSNNVSVLLGNGSGGIQSGATIFPIGAAPISVISADFNGDGKPDLATADYVTNEVSVLLGNGGGSFANKAEFPTGQTPYSVASADFNNDGKPDLTTANENSNSVSVLPGNGASPDPDPDPEPDPDPDPAAKISKVKVNGPAKVKKGKKATYVVKIVNSGDASAKGVRLKVSGRGISFNTSVGSIGAGKTRTVKVKIKPKKPGKFKASFKVTSKNAGGKT
ncbi:MAG: VCBS repeat-containing protein, partial [Solirubrobacterales bacterium]